MWHVKKKTGVVTVLFFCFTLNHTFECPERETLAAIHGETTEREGMG